MALGGITTTFDTATPSGSSGAGTADEDFRSIKTTFQQVLDSEHVFSATGGANTGIHRKGSAVAFVGAASAVSSTDTDGRLMVTSDTSRLYHVGSSVTMLLGGRYVPEHAQAINNLGSLTSSTVTQLWAMETGTGKMNNGSLSTSITLRHTYISGAAIGLVTPVSIISAGQPAWTGNGFTNTLVVGNYAAGTNTASDITYDFAYFVVGIRAG